LLLCNGIAEQRERFGVLAELVFVDTVVLVLIDREVIGEESDRQFRLRLRLGKLQRGRQRFRAGEPASEQE
jgi:hypothetical protein